MGNGQTSTRTLEHLNYLETERFDVCPCLSTYGMVMSRHKTLDAQYRRGISIRTITRLFLRPQVINP